MQCCITIIKICWLCWTTYHFSSSEFHIWHWAISHSSQWPTTGVTKAMVCAIPSLEINIFGVPDTPSCTKLKCVWHKRNYYKFVSDNDHDRPLISRLAILNGMVHIKITLLLIGKSSLCSGGRFPGSLSEWSFAICPLPYNCK